jgi:ABC-2 type transport system permease protein
MRKIITIAVREYRAMVATKAFLISIVMMPVLMLGGLLAMQLLRHAGTVSERRIAIVDQTGAFFDQLEAAATQRNQFLFPERVKSADDDDSEEEDDEGLPGFAKEKYLLEKIESDEVTNELQIQLSERIRNQDLYAFVVIPEKSDQPNATGEQQIRFHAQDSSLSEAREWIFRTINEIVKTRRLKASGIDPQIVQQLSQPVPVVGMGLAARSSDGTVNSKEENDPLKAIFLPMGVMMLMFMVIFMSSQPMLESVLEEKSQRIAEVLLGSANPFQLMSGKLLGTVAGSLTIFAIYLIGAWFLTVQRGWTDRIPFELIPWFVVFQVLGVLFYASIFLAIGASVSQLKEAQSMLLPVWMLMMCPMFVWIFIVRDPLGPMATYFSLFPPATPTAMMLRMATGQSIPSWQPILGSILTLIATLFIVVVASRIFRVGILWQGKTPKLSEILKWAVSG